MIGWSRRQVFWQVRRFCWMVWRSWAVILVQILSKSQLYFPKNTASDFSKSLYVSMSNHKAPLSPISKVVTWPRIGHHTQFLIDKLNLSSILDFMKKQLMKPSSVTSSFLSFLPSAFYLPAQAPLSPAPPLVSLQFYWLVSSTWNVKRQTI